MTDDIAVDFDLALRLAESQVAAGSLAPEVLPGIQAISLIFDEMKFGVGLAGGPMHLLPVQEAGTRSGLRPARS